MNAPRPGHIGDGWIITMVMVVSYHHGVVIL